MPVKIVVENVAADEKTDLAACLAFSVENVGTVPAFLTFDESDAPVQLPAGTTRIFPFLHDKYSGQMRIRFATPEEGQQMRINVVKSNHFCN